MTPEALVERDVLLAVGRDPAVLIAKNEVGVGYAGAVRFALRTTLEPWGKLAQQAVEATLTRHRLTWGLGVGSPDLVGAVLAEPWPVPLLWELKSDQGRLSPEQLRWHAAARRRGLTVSTIRSVDEALAALEAAKLGLR